MKELASMLLLLMLVAVESAAESSSNPKDPPGSKDNEIKRFGCSYKRLGAPMKYEMPTSSLSVSWPNDAIIYSEPITSRVKFQSEKELGTFLKMADSIIADEVKNTMFNNVDPFLEMYDDMKSSGTPFKQSYKDYHPKFPSGFEADEKKGPALLRIYERLVLKDPRVRDSFVMGTMDIDVDRVRAYALAETKDDQSPPADFKHKGLIGIILISVVPCRDCEPKNGVILLDVEDLGPKFPAEVVMEVDKDLKDMPKYASSSEFFQKTRKLYTGTPNYIIVQVHGENDVLCKEVPERFNLIYTKRSLCSMVETIGKEALLNTVRTMATFKNEMDNINHKSLMIKTAAYVTVDFKTKAVRLYTDKANEDYEHYRAITTLEQGDVYIQLSDFGYSGKVTQLQGDYIQAVQERMNTKYLKSKLDRLFKVLGDAEFMKWFLKAHEEYYLSLHKKSSKSIFEKFKNNI